MNWSPISKSPESWLVLPNLLDYERTRRTFLWDDIRRDLDGLPGRRGLNIAYEVVDRHATGQKRDHVAIRWLGKDGAVQIFTYREVSDLSNRFANVLTSLGVGKEDRVFALAGRIPALYVAALGTLKNGTITVTSLGDLGVRSVYGVIYPPQVALVGFGKITEQPWAENGMLGIRPIFTATLAADYRATDGHRGAQFLDVLNHRLQDPEKL